MKGLVSKGIGGFYTVKTESGSYRARGRGKIKNDDLILTIGDYVELIPPNKPDDDGLITEIYPRKNIFTRPPVANLDIMVVVMAATAPAPNLYLCDKMLVVAEQRGVNSVVCINKADIGDKKKISEIADIYKSIYKTCVVSAYTREGLEELCRAIRDKKAAFVGPSGVGKSTLINSIVPEAEMETGRVSRKTERGRHTTRHVELLDTGEGYIFDTPGFTSFALEDMSVYEVSHYFPEIRRESTKCKFDDCMHKNEPDCAVLVALQEGKISESRYNSYLACMEDAKKSKKY